MHMSVDVPSMFVLGIFNLMEVAGKTTAQMGVHRWRIDDIEYFGTWDDCGARAIGAFVDKNGKEIQKTV